MNIQSRLFSKENIYLAISMVHSYVLNIDLMDQPDIELYWKLVDLFDESTVGKVYDAVERKLKKVFHDKNEFFTARAYFNPKKYIAEKDMVVFRPLHTATLIEQIAMVAMLQVLVYEIEDDRICKSELSRHLPSNFYGNRIDFDGIHLFKRWQDQYGAFSDKANDLLKKYCETKEYKYELSLDIKNFFPSINPEILFRNICSLLPEKQEQCDMSAYKTIIYKLLYIKLDTSGWKSEECEWYFEGNCNRDKLAFVKGIPQGLPYAYFFANIFMLEIEKIFKKFIAGEMLFYVDDSVVFTNLEQTSDGINGDNTQNVIFERIIKDINKLTSYISFKYKHRDDFLQPDGYSYVPEDFRIEIHDPAPSGKSTIFDLREVLKESGITYLHGIGREVSMMGFQMSTIYSKQDLLLMQRRIEGIKVALKNEIARIKEKTGNHNAYLSKLTRYYKFFSLRYVRCDLRIKAENKSSDWLIEQLEEMLNIKDVGKGLSEWKEGFFLQYSDDILLSIMAMAFKHAEKDDITKLRDLLLKVNIALYGKTSVSSYFDKLFSRYCVSEYRPIIPDKYFSIVKIVYEKYALLSRKVQYQKYWEFEKIISSSMDNIYISLKIETLMSSYSYIRHTNSYFDRMILNAIFSVIFGYHVSDSFEFGKIHSKEAITIAEVRVLSRLRNKWFRFDDFVAFYHGAICDEYRATIDYEVLQVVGIFYKYVVNPIWIDNLILVHKYCTDTWKNGSKHLHFYTLHNQEHAVELIKNIVKICHAISFFSLKEYDFYLLFASCYLHDISMVTIPDGAVFYNSETEQVYDVLEKFKNNTSSNEDSKQLCKSLYESYMDIDAILENQVRSRHNIDSAKEIRFHEELKFISDADREFIAEISEAHCFSTSEVYCTKAEGSTSLLNLKFDKILLRLADLFDISRYRISKVVLMHNLDKMNPTSRFHWISHLLTENCSLETEYSSKEDINYSFLCNKAIKECLSVNIDITLSQRTHVENKYCNNVSDACYGENDENKWIIKVADEQCKTGCARGKNNACIFLCKWFNKKNNWLIDELYSLQKYLNDVPENFFQSEITVRLNITRNTDMPNEVFDYLHEYLDD